MLFKTILSDHLNAEFTITNYGKLSIFVRKHLIVAVIMNRFMALLENSSAMRFPLLTFRCIPITALSRLRVAAEGFLGEGEFVPWEAGTTAKFCRKAQLRPPLSRFFGYFLVETRKCRPTQWIQRSKLLPHPKAPSDEGAVSEAD